MRVGVDPLAPRRGWVPGVADGERHSVLGAFVWGCRRALGRIPAVLVLWIANLGFAAVVVAPVFAALYEHTAYSPRVDDLANNFDAVWFTDFAASYAGVLNGIGSALAGIGVLYVLLQLFLAAGTIDVLHAGVRDTTPRHLARAGGTYIGRFLRIALVAAPAYLAVIVLDRNVHLAVKTLTRDGALERASLWGHGAHGILTAALLLIVMLVVDLARVRVVLTGSRSTLLELARSTRLVARHPVRLGGLYLLSCGVGGVLVLVAAGLRSNGGHFLIAFLAVQAFVLARTALRVATWGALLSLARGLAVEGVAGESRV